MVLLPQLGQLFVLLTHLLKLQGDELQSVKMNVTSASYDSILRSQSSFGWGGFFSFRNDYSPTLDHNSAVLLLVQAVRNEHRRWTFPLSLQTVD